MTRGRSIGMALKELTSEFPDVSVSKLRYLETEGLVNPRRTASGYRRYTDDDIERLRFILSQQRDHYLPLKVIREQLAALDAQTARMEGGAQGAAALGEPAETAARLRAADGSGASSAGPRGAVEAREVVDPRVVFERRGAGDADADARLTMSEIADEARCTIAEVGSLVQAQLLRPDESGYFGPADVAVAGATVAAMRAGFEIRELKRLSTAASRHADLVVQHSRAACLSRGETSTEQLRSAARPAAELLASLHGALVRRDVDDELRP